MKKVILLLLIIFLGCQKDEPTSPNNILNQSIIPDTILIGFKKFQNVEEISVANSEYFIGAFNLTKFAKISIEFEAYPGPPILPAYWYDGDDPTNSFYWGFTTKGSKNTVINDSFTVRNYKKILNDYQIVNPDSVNFYFGVVSSSAARFRNHRILGWKE
ncbi:MAG: hypothetical protein QME52_04315 [Bacteroidota bacterium]|nr:hypothetical protein [Bacteroidota bacterium]